TESERNAESASIVEAEKLVSWMAWRPKVTIATRSELGFASTNARAAAAASASGLPTIDRETSTAVTKLLPRPRLSVWRPTTGWPFSRTTGGRLPGCDVTTVASTVG